MRRRWIVLSCVVVWFLCGFLAHGIIFAYRTGTNPKAFEGSMYGEELRSSLITVVPLGGSALLGVIVFICVNKLDTPFHYGVKFW